MTNVEFTGNYEDLSTDAATSSSSTARGAATATCRALSPRSWGWRARPCRPPATCSAASSGSAASSAYEIQRAVGGPAHDAALREAVAEIRPKFRQCTRCGNWVCEPICFNSKAQLCEACAPDMDEEIAAAQAEAAREQAFEKAKSVDWMKGRDLDTVAGAACKSCGAKTGGAKFCPECGAPQSQKRRCGGCGHEVEGSPKFCPECGEKIA